jgi:DNA mismatch repair protein MutS
MDEKSLDEKNNNYIGCIEKVNNSFVFAYIELRTGEAKVTEYTSFEIAISQINKLNIKEVVVNKNFPTNYRHLLNKVYGVLVSEVAKIELSNYQENLFTNIKNDFLEPCKRLLFYILNTRKRALFHLTPFELYTNKDYLGLDLSAVKNLELVESLKGAKNKNNLFSVLDRCSTAMGSRYLKQNILFPLINLNKINQRLDIVEAFYKNQILVKDLHQELNEIYDLERIVGRISYGSVSPKDLIQLRNSLSVLPNIIRLLNKFKSPTVKNIANAILKSIDTEFKEEYKKIISDSPVSQFDSFSGATIPVYRLNSALTHTQWFMHQYR